MTWIAIAAAFGIGIQAGLIIGLIIAERNISYLASQALVNFNHRIDELHWCNHDNEDEEK